ncbi:MAG TPA: FkbM family methyltransferase [Polyangiaceae bacterium]|nr:FkbM family methyltransferase [Polyangiaceae bacterium]
MRDWVSLAPTLPVGARLALSYIRRELPAWGMLYRSSLVRGTDGTRWSAAPTCRVRGKLHGYEMEVDLSNWSERYTYFLGRYYDLPTQLLLLAYLKPGDRFVDVGANIGMITLLAARLVGSTGAVDAVEPNPLCAARIRRSLADNGVTWARVHAFGLGDCSGVLELSVVDGHTGAGTFAHLDPREHNLTARMPVRVIPGDVLLEASLPVNCIKIDVEGYECHVLAGLGHTIARSRPLVITEAIALQLARCGRDLDQLVRFMRGHGYEGFALSSRRRALRQRLALVPFENGSVPDGRDIAWIHPTDRRRSALLRACPTL